MIAALVGIGGFLVYLPRPSTGADMLSEAGRTGMLARASAQQDPGAGGIASQSAPTSMTDPTVDLLNSGNEEDIQRELGVSSDEAKSIIKARPYRKLDDLLTKNAVSKKTFKQVRKRLKQGHR